MIFKWFRIFIIFSKHIPFLFTLAYIEANPNWRSLATVPSNWLISGTPVGSQERSLLWPCTWKVSLRITAVWQSVLIFFIRFSPAFSLQKCRQLAIPHTAHTQTIPATTLTAEWSPRMQAILPVVVSMEMWNESFPMNLLLLMMSIWT